MNKFPGSSSFASEVEESKESAELDGNRRQSSYNASQIILEEDEDAQIDSSQRD